jgi:sulfatase maturation enzyme AslB (radical SAM superfamily)
MSEHHDETRSSITPTSAAEPTGATMVDRSGRIVLPADVLARAGIAPGQDVFVEAGPGGIRIVPNALRKVYVEPTSRCNLACAMCVRHGLQEPLGDMSLDRYARLLDGLPADGTERLMLAFSGFGEPLVHQDWHEMGR